MRGWGNDVSTLQTLGACWDNGMLNHEMAKKFNEWVARTPEKFEVY